MQQPEEEQAWAEFEHPSVPKAPEPPPAPSQTQPTAEAGPSGLGPPKATEGILALLDLSNRDQEGQAEEADVDAPNEETVQEAVVEVPVVIGGELAMKAAAPMEVDSESTVQAVAQEAQQALKPTARTGSKRKYKYRQHARGKKTDCTCGEDQRRVWNRVVVGNAKPGRGTHLQGRWQLSRKATGELVAAGDIEALLADVQAGVKVVDAEHYEWSQQKAQKVAELCPSSQRKAQKVAEAASGPGSGASRVARECRRAGRRSD